MPFIRGRYHINPIMGEALEAARDAEAALLALKQNSRRNGDSTSDRDSNDQQGDYSGDNSSDNANARAAAAKGPVHRVEIEAAEMVPSYSGRGQRGYAMRLHRLPAPNSNPGYDSEDGSASNATSYGRASRSPSRNAAPRSASQSDTHIFSNHNDLLDFLREELADDSANQ